jgi:hypothetical protein
VAPTLPSSASADAPRATAAQDDVTGITLDSPETYRNTSILMAIRNAGFVCIDIIAADAGSDQVSAWRVVCDGALVYLVGADDAGGFAVEPVYYGDALSPFDPRSGPSDQSPLNRPRMELIPVEPR